MILIIKAKRVGFEPQECFRQHLDCIGSIYLEKSTLQTGVGHDVVEQSLGPRFSKSHLDAHERDLVLRKNR